MPAKALADLPTLSTEEMGRYQRHLSLKGFGPDAQRRLKASHVLVIGAGGLGCPALLYLAAAGVGQLTIMDPDRIDISNLQRQVLYTQDDLGAFKAEAAARRLSSLNSLIQVTPRCERFTRSNALERVRAADLVLDGSDNFATRYLANDACVLTGRPLVYGAIHQFEGQLSVFNLGDGPTYRCLFPEPPDPASVPNCAEAGVLGILPGLIGTAQAAEAIKVLAGIGEPLSGRLLLWNALTMSSRLLRFKALPASRRITELPPEDYGRTCCSAPTASTPDEIDATELARLLSVPGGIQLLDVREDHEIAVEGAIEPAVHLPLGALRNGHAPAGLSPETPTVVYCAGGVRSLNALPLLRQQHGFTSVRSLRGGFRAWKNLTR
jgi:adenylyltransferase/sulfurtransferase